MLAINLTESLNKKPLHRNISTYKNLRNIALPYLLVSGLVIEQS